jgi:fumarate hydratase, class II
MAEQTHRIERVEANEKRCKEMVEQSLAMVTALAPVIGYDHAAKIAKGSLHHREDGKRGGTGA